MYNSLKKHGLSDTKHHLKQYLSGGSSHKTSGKRGKISNIDEKSVNISHFNINTQT